MVRWRRTGPNLKEILSGGVGFVRWRRIGMWDETWDHCLLSQPKHRTQLVETSVIARGTSVIGVHSRDSVNDRGNRLDLDQLVGVPQHSDPNQRARNVMLTEGIAHDLPGGHQVRLV